MIPCGTDPAATTTPPRPSRDEILVRVRSALGQLSRSRRQENEFPLTFALRSVLFTIGERGDLPPTVSELAETERVTTPAISRSISRLESLGLVERVGDESDQRLSRVRVTDQGLDVQREILRTGDTWFTHRIDRLDNVEIAKLAAALPVLEKLCAPPSR